MVHSFQLGCFERLIALTLLPQAILGRNMLRYNGLASMT